MNNLESNALLPVPLSSDSDIYSPAKLSAIPRLKIMEVSMRLFLSSLFNIDDTRLLALLLGRAAQYANHWLTHVPSSFMGTVLSPDRSFLWYTLAIPLGSGDSVFPCFGCGDTIDSFGDHAIQCPHAIDCNRGPVKDRHDRLVREFSDILKEAAYHTRIEPCVSDSDGRRGDIYVSNFSGGHPVVFDIGVTSVLCDSNVVSASSVPLF